MTPLRNRLGFILNITLIVLTLGISILGFLTYKHLNEITEKLRVETRPNTNFLLYKDILMNVSQMEDKVNTYRINEDPLTLKDFYSLHRETKNIIDSASSLYPNDLDHREIMNSFTELFDKYYLILGKLSQIEREEVEETLSNIQTGLHQLAVKEQATDTSVQQEPEPEIKEEEPKRLLDLFKRKKEVTEIPEEAIVDSQVKLDSLEQNMEALLKSVKDNTLQEVKQKKRLELNYTSQLNIIQVNMLELVEQLESIEIMRSRTNTLNAQELISNTNNQISIFSGLATILLIITLIILFVFTTRNKQYNAVLQRAKQNAESLAKSKEYFLANMSHEIRTPINAIIGFTNQLGKADLEAPQKEQVEIIQKASTHLLSILNDILDFTKLQNEKLKLDKEQFYINQVVKSTVQILQAKAEENGNEIITELSENDIAVNGDPYRLKQVIINIVGNSIKFTTHGEIRISVDTSILGPKRLLMEMKISDTGIGIAKESQAKVFDEFEQAHKSATTTGTGLGLSIVKKIVELHHGQISLKSEENVGTEITIMLPYDIIPKEEILTETDAKLVENPRLKDLKVLIADDEPFNLKLLEAILQPYSSQIIQATDGQTALDLLNSEKFDIALLDIKMPHYSGWQIAHETRNGEGPNRTTPLIALTATIAEEAQYKGLKVGFNKLMRKPFSESELLNSMANELNIEADSINNTPNNESNYYQEEINTETLERLGDQQFVKEMLESFLESSSKNIEEIQHHLEKENLMMVSELAHKTVAPIRLLDHQHLVKALKQIEKLADQGEKPPKDLVRDTVKMYTDLSKNISQYLQG
ncbi:ATP-binding protein [Marinoscillum sp. MHG1-6]|uniref:ATP-binding protein n=1 Tax=Marinoscillum sp. MHG1-6 TaxID=2959627 RepID=UPI00215895A5|nr:ATP-binding protein [Marinoscillum sp. MHG1-6]